MLVCPQCQFSNPNANKFCQQCGTSLTHKACPDCGTVVPLNVLQCSNCGTLTGIVWLAIISSPTQVAIVEPDHLVGATTTSDSVASAEDVIDESAPETPQPLQETQPEGSPTASLVSQAEVWESEPFETGEIPVNDCLSNAAAPLPTLEPLESLPLNAGNYLDIQHRYQLVEPILQLEPGETVTVSVLDGQPLQMSPLKALQDSATEPDEAKMDAFIIPAAQAYFALQAQSSQSFPQLQDAWEQPPYTVMILENKRHLPQLLDKLKQPETTSEQILQWLQSIAELWGMLTPWNCRQSLLEPTNLRIQPNQIVCLQQLYSEPIDAEISLMELGQVWKQLFQASQRTLLGSLTQLLQQLIEGDIQTLEKLQQELTTALQELKPDIPQPSAVTQLQINEDTIPSLETNLAPTMPPIVPLVQLEAVGGTDVGRQRQHNEDAFGVQTLLNYQQTHIGQSFDAKGLYVLCDGMGGHAGGEVASQLAVETLRQYFHSQWVGELPTEEMVREAILQTNHVIYGLNQQQVRSGAGRMGTTLVMAVVADHQVEFAHVGDSRLYRLTRQRGLEQMTVDHEVGQRSIQQGIDPETAYSSPDAYQLTQALGPRDREYVKPDVQLIDITEDTLFILASDGLTDNDLLETYRSTHLDPFLDTNASLAIGVQGLIDLANQYNGHDNISVILVRAQVGSN